jgi:hypothetical protein
MFGDWKRACTSRTLVDSALAGSQFFASFFSAPISFVDSGNMMTSTTTQNPTTTHLLQLPAGISAILPSLLIASPAFRWPPPASVVHSYATTGPRWAQQSGKTPQRAPP